MPNPVINRRLYASGGVCSAGLSTVAAWTAFEVGLGGIAPSAAVQTAMANLYCGLISDGLLSQILSLYPFPPVDVGTVAPNTVPVWIMTQTPLIHTIGANHA